MGRAFFLLFDTITKCEYKSQEKIMIYRKFFIFSTLYIQNVGVYEEYSPIIWILVYFEIKRIYI